MIFILKMFNRNKIYNMNNPKESLNNTKESLNNTKESLNNTKESLNNTKESLNKHLIKIINNYLSYNLPYVNELMNNTWEIRTLVDDIHYYDRHGIDFTFKYKFTFQKRFILRSINGDWGINYF